MKSLPPRIKAVFMKLKSESTQYIEIKYIKGYFFAYQSTSRWDKEKKKPIKVPLYLGRITNAGQFIPAKKKKPRNITQPAAPVIEQPILDLGQKTLEAVVREEKKYKHEPKLLTALSMNGRISMSVLGKMVDLKETAVSSQVKKLERKYDIKYIAEMDTTKLGYLQFLITVKFLDKFPKTDELKKILEKEARVQLALITKGDFDLMMYALAKTSEEINLLVLGLRTKLDYQAIWNAGPVFDDYGFIPVRSDFIDLLKKDLLEREYAVLKELGKNGKIDFTEIDDLYKFDKGRSQYSYYRLKEKGIIKRITISMHNLPLKYVAIIYEDIVNWKEFRTNRESSLKNVIQDSITQINKYVLVDDTVSPNGTVLYLPVFKDGDLESAIDQLTSLNLGVKIRTFIITSIILGDFCFRNFDNNYSLQQEIRVKEYKLKPPPKIDYEETGRIKKERMKYSDIRGLKPEAN
jgi:DNA-binding Lrp family transcriptional regulator